MTIRLEQKRPDEKLRLSHDWAPFLGTDTIASKTVTSSDLTVVSSAINGTAVDYVIDGGTDGDLATITMAIVTAAGDKKDQIFVIPVRNSSEPVSLAEAKDQMGVLDTSRDNMILGFISAARRYCENRSDHIFVRRSFTRAFHCWGNYLEIALRPLISVDAITYTLDDGTVTPYTGFTVNSARGRTRIYAGSSGFPTLGLNGTIAVTFTAGYADGDTPEEARQAILMLAAHWFAQRESVNVVNGLNPIEVPLATTELLNSFRAMVV